MGDVNQQAYLRHWVPRIDGPVLEVGSKEYGSTSSFRDFYAGCEYVGLGICCSVLEHVAKPWDFAANLTESKADQKQKRKYLPYLMANILGMRRGG